ncbi:MAG: serine O-acetyltransferase [Planctomycetota bacterium]|jgi:serine O-acetyltransferase
MNEPIDENLEKFTEQIEASYAADERTQRIGLSALPSRSRIVEILQQMRELLFPGYFGDKTLTPANIRSHVDNLLVRLGAELSEQINHCLCVDRRCDQCDKPDTCRAEAQQQTREFVKRIPDVRAMLALDAQAAYDGDPAAKSIEEVIYCYPGFYAVTVYRIAHELLTPHSITGCDIHPGAQIGRSFFIDHATGVVVGETTRIGDNVKIYQGVTLGAMSFPKDERGRVIKGLQRHPTLEDNATIYANATILGGDTVIGKGVTVAGNTFVTKSIVDNAVVSHEVPKLRVKSKKNE